jgi:hypothetical protein
LKNNNKTDAQTDKQKRKYIVKQYLLLIEARNKMGIAHFKQKADRHKCDVRNNEYREPFAVCQKKDNYRTQYKICAHTAVDAAKWKISRCKEQVAYQNAGKIFYLIEHAEFVAQVEENYAGNKYSKNRKNERVVQTNKNAHNERRK